MMLYEDPRIARFNSKLKKIRMIRGFTQESLSELSNVNIKSIAAYEQNPEKILTASSITLYASSTSFALALRSSLRLAIAS